MKFTLMNPVFDCQVLVVIGGKRGDPLRELKRRYGVKVPDPKAVDNSTAKASFFCMDGGLASAIWLSQKPKGAAAIATLAHEACHYARHICRRSGAHGEETQCYLVEWLVREILKRAG